MSDPNTQPDHDDQDPKTDWEKDTQEGVRAALDFSTTLTTTISVDPTSDTDEIIFLQIADANEDFSLAEPEALQELLERAGLSITEPITIVLVTDHTHTRIQEISAQDCDESILAQGLERMGLARVRDLLVQALATMPSSEDVQALARHFASEILEEAIMRHPLGDGLQLINPEDITVQGVRCPGCQLLIPSALMGAQDRLAKSGDIFGSRGPDGILVGVFPHEVPFSQHLNAEVANQMSAALPEAFQHVARAYAGEQMAQAQISGRRGRKVAAFYDIPQADVETAADAQRDRLIERAQTRTTPDDTKPSTGREDLPPHVREIFLGLGAEFVSEVPNPDPMGLGFLNLGGFSPWRRDRPTGPQAR